MNASTLPATATRDVAGTPVTLTERGDGRPVLLLHGGGGPQTVDPWADRLAATLPARVLTPVHPGFGGTPRPSSLESVPGLATLYLGLLDALGLEDVLVVGNSIGGWIAAEMAVAGSPRIGGVVLVDAVGIEVEGHPVVDFFDLTPAEIADLSYADPATYGIDPTALPPEAQQAMAANRAALATYAGAAMADPTLRGRLATVTAPTLVVWGEADRISDTGLGRAYAAAIPGARFELLAGAGHLPQIEQPDALIDVVRDFIAP